MKILCYGDSNTWGYIPNINGYSKNAIMKQYAESDCWWYSLKAGNEVFIDGKCGRCIAHENRWLENRNASKTIYDDLKLYRDLDLIILQLGTNDCKGEYADTALQITQNLQTLINKIKNMSNAQIAIISPAIIKENNPITLKYYVGAQSKSEELDKLYHELALQEGCFFISGKDLEIGEDGEHLTKLGHKQLGTKVIKKINANQFEDERCE